jgi:hypothetical protein
MNDVLLDVGGAGGLTALLIQAIKWGWRKWIVKDPLYDFPALFYLLFTPLSNALMPFFLLWLGLQAQSPLFGMDAMAVVKYLVVIALSTLVSFIGYNTGIKPLATYRNARIARKAKVI